MSGNGESERAKARAERAARLLDTPVSEDYLREQAERYRQRKEAVRAAAKSVVVFRIGNEWLALPTATFSEVLPLRPIHSLPNRDPVVAGIVNVRGELLVCVSLAVALGLAAEPETGPRARLAVICRERGCLVFVAAEIAALHRYDDAWLQPRPATLAQAQATFTRGVLDWEGRSVGLLDEGLLFYQLNRRIG